MCGRFAAVAPTRYLAERFSAVATPTVGDHQPSWNVAPSLDLRAVVERQNQGRLVVPLRWGLVPHWASDPSIGNRLTNARAETVATKPAFAAALSRRRCLVPADGFYEWARVENGTKRGGRQPYWFTRRDHDLIALGGLWETWRDPSGELVRTVCLITTEGNADLEGVHDRMPVIIEPADWDRWLNPEVSDPNGVADLLRPSPQRRLERHPVSAAVNKTDVDGPSLVDPIDLPDGNAPIPLRLI